VLVLTMHDDDDSVFAAMRAGARGYVLKGTSQQALVAAIQAVARGEAIFGPSVATRVLGYFTGRKPTLAQPFPELTAREREVLGLIAQGLNNAAIAQRLQLAPKTVRNLASSIFAKLQVADRAQAMRRALDEGLGK
jgi:DNA-binding NarL/FixJ family response regulator